MFVILVIQELGNHSGLAGYQLVREVMQNKSRKERLSLKPILYLKGHEEIDLNNQNYNFQISILSLYGCSKYRICVNRHPKGPNHQENKSLINIKIPNNNKVQKSINQPK